MWPDAVTVVNADGERMEVGEVVAGNTPLEETSEGGGRPAWLDNETVDMGCDDQSRFSESKEGKATATAWQQRHAWLDGDEAGSSRHEKERRRRTCRGRAPPVAQLQSHRGASSAHDAAAASREGREVDEGNERRRAVSPPRHRSSRLSSSLLVKLKPSGPVYV